MSRDSNGKGMNPWAWILIIVVILAAIALFYHFVYRSMSPAYDTSHNSPPAEIYAEPSGESSSGSSSSPSVPNSPPY